ncbi:putative transcription factor WRKY family [Lupinus albus]|uniref:Putative transcription factor WRKY family n=1 Tax=Lupinus albus TaxID=3870 RepID=A0A6A4NZC0_LUPAL|nr:putative transcription factor WRKY family [Lupinus albus]
MTSIFLLLQSSICYFYISIINSMWPFCRSKIKKKGQKRIRQQRFAFMTKSDVDHLEDGYRWRKYGQKAVKNSPFPRFISENLLTLYNESFYLPFWCKF